jgi:hypothetical protein
MSRNPEVLRLQETRTAKIPWRKWWPYLSERQWGTVPEDYSQDGVAQRSERIKETLYGCSPAAADSAGATAAAPDER